MYCKHHCNDLRIHDSRAPGQDSVVWTGNIARVKTKSLCLYQSDMNGEKPSDPQRSVCFLDGAEVLAQSDLPEATRGDGLPGSAGR